MNSELIGAWALNEGTGSVAIDGSGSGNNGAWSGNPTGTSSYYSPGNSMPWVGVFDGSTDFISQPNIPAFSFGLEDFSISFWINPQGDWTGATQGIIGQKTNDASPGFQIYHDSGDGDNLRLRLGDFSGTDDSSTTPNTIPRGQWTACLVVRISGVVTWYVNGAAVSSTNVTRDISGGNANFNIGTADTWPTPFFNGFLSNVRIYNAAVVPIGANPSINALTPPLAYRIGNSDRTVGGPTGAPDGFTVLNLSNGNMFVALGGAWTIGVSPFDFPTLLATWFGTDAANMNGNMIKSSGPGYRIGTTDRVIGGATGAADGFYVLNTTTGHVFKAMGGVWVSGTFPADLIGGWSLS